MKKAFRIILWIVLLFVVVCALALSALYISADPNKLKPVITSEVLKRTGYRLDIDGDLSWSIYPQVGVKAAHLTLTAPNEKHAFLDLQRVNIAVELSQLLRGVNKLRGEVHIASAKFMNVQATSALVGLHWQDKTLTCVEKGLKRVKYEQRRMNHNKYDEWIYSAPTRDELVRWVNSLQLLYIQ